MIGIYKITSPNNKVYIGQSWDIEQRKKSYEWLQCKGQHKIYNSILKHKWDNHKFETIHELPLDVTQDILDQYEIIYWKQYKDCGFKLLNIKEPGLGGKHSLETRNKISNKLKGRIFSEEIKLKMSIGGKGKSRKGAGPRGPLSEETKQKIKEGNKGKIQSEESKLKISNTKKGVPNPKLREKIIGKKHSVETIQKMKQTWLMKRTMNTQI